MDHTTTQYLSDNINGPLSKALADMALAQPRDGVDFLTNWLQVYLDQAKEKSAADNGKQQIGSSSHLDAMDKRYAQDTLDEVKVALDEAKEIHKTMLAQTDALLATSLSDLESEILGKTCADAVSDLTTAGVEMRKVCDKVKRRLDKWKQHKYSLGPFVEAKEELNKIRDEATQLKGMVSKKIKELKAAEEVAQAEIARRIEEERRLAEELAAQQAAEEAEAEGAENEGPA